MRCHLYYLVCALFRSPPCNVTTQARAPRHVEAQVRQCWPVGRPGPRPVHFAKRPSVRGGRERDAIKFWLLGWHGPVFEFELEFVLCGPRAQGARPAHPPLRNVHGDVLRQRGGVVAWCVLLLPLCVLCLSRARPAPCEFARVRCRVTVTLVHRWKRQRPSSSRMYCLKTPPATMVCAQVLSGAMTRARIG